MTSLSERHCAEEEPNQSRSAPRHRLERLQLLPSGFRPYFTCVVATAQLCMLIWLCWATTFAEVGLSPIVYQRIEPNTFRGNVTVTYTERPNPFIGPPSSQLVSLGALYPPCIREDHALNVQQIKALYPRPEAKGEGLGCCEVPQSNVAGTTTKVECNILSNGHAQWRATQCSQRSSLQSIVQHILRPCCGELSGHCTLTSPQHCWFMNGRFHVHADHCTQIGSLFTKHDSPQTGTGPAVGGILGLALVEHVILFPTVKEPKRRLALLISCFFVLFVFGTFPHMNNFSLIAGLLYGCLFALSFWSCIMFERKVALFQFLFVFVIVTVFLFSLVLFYGVQHIHASSFFRYLNCIPYAEGLCDYV